MRKIPKKIKTQKKFTCEICKSDEFLEEHHILGRKIPNPNKKSNLCYICPNCHYKVHLGEIIIEGWLNTTNGYQLFWHNKNEINQTGFECIPHLIKQE